MGKEVRDLMDKNFNSCAEISEAYYRALHPEEFQPAVNKSKGVRKMYPIGSWVKVKMNEYPNTIGYIAGFNNLTEIYLIKVTIIKGLTVKSGTNVILQFPKGYLDLLEDLEGGFDTSFLHDLALDWSLAKKNKELFNELLNGRNE
jgi:hypothetical protein